MAADAAHLQLVPLTCRLLQAFVVHKAGLERSCLTGITLDGATGIAYGTHLQLHLYHAWPVGIALLHALEESAVGALTVGPAELRVSHIVGILLGSAQVAERHARCMDHAILHGK